jgi:hypothetical protein
MNRGAWTAAAPPSEVQEGAAARTVAGAAFARLATGAVVRASAAGLRTVAVCTMTSPAVGVALAPAITGDATRDTRTTARRAVEERRMSRTLLGTGRAADPEPAVP